MRTPRMNVAVRSVELVEPRLYHVDLTFCPLDDRRALCAPLGWDRYVGPQGQIVGMHTFGASAPLKEVQRKFGFTPGRVVEAARDLLK